MTGFEEACFEDYVFDRLFCLDAADGGGDGLVVMFVCYFVLHTNHHSAGFVEFIGGPETCTHVFVGKLSVVIAESILADVQKLEVSLFEVGLFREFPACGACIVCRLPVVKTAVLFAVVEVIAIAIARIEIHHVCIFGHPDTVTRFDGRVSLALAFERLGGFIIVAVINLFASRKQHGNSENEVCHGNELELHKFNLLKIVFNDEFFKSSFFRAQM